MGSSCVKRETGLDVIREDHIDSNAMFHNIVNFILKQVKNERYLEKQKARESRG
jgi:predicted transglutaminase-like protease